MTGKFPGTGEVTTSHHDMQVLAEVKGRGFGRGGQTELRARGLKYAFRGKSEGEENGSAILTLLSSLKAEHSYPPHKSAKS